MLTVFWCLMLGTHPRVGEDSPVRRIRCCTPVIEGIRVHLLGTEETRRKEKIKGMEEDAIQQTYRLKANYLRPRGER